MSEDAFHAQHARKERPSAGEREGEEGEPTWLLREQPHDPDFGYDCEWLERAPRGNGSGSGPRARCRIYSVRPSQCRTWPFWPEVLRSRDDWEFARLDTPCHGMGKGELRPAGEIARLLEEATANAAADC